LEEWAGNQTAESVLSFDGSSPAEQALQDISIRAKEGNFHYSRFFAIGLFRILNLAKASDPTTLEKVGSRGVCDNSRVCWLFKERVVPLLCRVILQLASLGSAAM
jgi:hypothetical protein